MAIQYIEVFGDYDGVLFEYNDETDVYTNVFTRQEFKTYKQYPEYGPSYQYDKEGNLNGYSQYKAEGLTIKDDLSLTENNLWGNRGIDGKGELVFKPLKDLSIPHIKNILMNVQNVKKEYKLYFLNRLEGVINVNIAEKK